jgi:hypothetical protein
MKVFSTVIGLTLLLSSASQAGWKWNKEAYREAKSSMVEQRVTSPSYCFDTGFEFSGFVSGLWPEDNRLDNALGGGVALAYFFGHNFGLQGSYMVHGSGTANGSDIQVGTFSAVYRLPLGGECCSTIAPYFFGGPGVISAGSSEMLWHLGGGLDIRFESWGCVGLFGDFSYNWVDQGQPDFTLFRAGIRVPF